jgi:hypothetical protein
MNCQAGNWHSLNLMSGSHILRCIALLSGAAIWVNISSFWVEQRFSAGYNSAFKGPLS